MFRVIVRNSIVLVPLFLLLRALLPFLSEDEFKRKLLENCSNNQEMTVLYHRIFLDMVQCDPVLSDIDFIQNRVIQIVNLIFSTSTGWGRLVGIKLVNIYTQDQRLKNVHTT